MLLDRKKDLKHMYINCLADFMTCFQYKQLKNK